MRAGESWNANLVLPAPPGGVGPASARAASKQDDAYLLERAQRRGRVGVPGLPGESAPGR